MRGTTRFLRPILELGALAIFIAILILIFQLKPIEQASVAQFEPTLLEPYPIQELTPSSSSEEHNSTYSLSPTNPYPPPNGSAVFPPLPSKVQALLGKRSVLGRVTGVTRDRGRIWLIPPDDQAKTITEFGDVAAVYGWNYDGTKLLFGRGLYKTSGELANATELWIYDFNSGQAFQLVDSQRVWSASWSPIDDRVGYCEFGDPPTVSVISLDGKIQQKRENLYPEFAWSPDGSAIAVKYVGPEMIDFDTKYPVIGIWWLAKDELKLLNNATREDHSYPIWTIDGNQIIFHRSFGPGSTQGEDGLYIADVKTGSMTLYPNDPETVASGLMRSPKADVFIFRLGLEIYVMEYGNKPTFIGKGSKPAWLSDGKTVIYYDEKGEIQTIEFDFPVKNQVIGGFSSAMTIHLQPDIFFKRDTSQ